MHEKISDVTIMTIIISTFMLVFLGGIIIFFLFAYQKKGYRHQEELLVLNETFNKTLLLSKLEIREQTLDHIAKELHANISQLASVININISAYLQLCKGQPDENISETKILIKQLMAEIKSLSVTLNTEHIRNAGFLTMLKTELGRLEKTGLYKVGLLKTGEEYRLQPEHEIILFRLCQEILNNIIKHACANVINVQVGYGDDHLLISISDDGKGFDVDEVTRKSSITNSTGITNIFNRSKQINGSVSIISTDKGTDIAVKIPSPINL